MVVLALIALAVAAAAPAVAAALGPLSRGRLEVPEWASSVVALPALGVAALASTRTTPVTGFALGATFVLCVLAAATAGAPLVLATFKIARRQPDGSPAPDAGPLRGGRCDRHPRTARGGGVDSCNLAGGDRDRLGSQGARTVPGTSRTSRVRAVHHGNLRQCPLGDRRMRNGTGTHHVGDECPSRSMFATRGAYRRWPPSGG